MKRDSIQQNYEKTVKKHSIRKIPEKYLKRDK
jgi:hypothetical protein